MKNRILSILLTMSVILGCFSNFSITTFAATSGTYKQNVVEPYATGDKVMSILASGWALATDRDYETTYTNLRYFTSLNDFGDGAYHNYSGYQSSGADKEYLYSGSYSSSSNQYSSYKVINTTNNSYYNPITNTYTTNNKNIYYNTENNTYLFEGDEYNTYITNNITYVSYYIINNSTSESSYHEIYYQLPDGRNSYELTADDVWGEYFIYNAVNYNLVKEDDGITLGLYHFDNDLFDSSSFSSTDTFVLWDSKTGSYHDGKFDKAFGYQSYSNTYATGSLNFPNGTKSFECWFYYSPNIYTSAGLQSFDVVVSNFSAAKFDIQTGVWHHLYVSLESNNTENASLYLNGKYICNLQNCVFGNQFRFNSSCILNDSSVGNSQLCLVDELRFLSIDIHPDGDFSPPSQPYDTNLVLVLPETGNTNDIAVKSNTPVSNIRVGGVRPTIPSNGYVYVYLEDDIVKDIQQYQTDGWYSVEASIYEDNTWVTLKDKNLSSYTITEEDFPTTDTENPDVTPTPTPDGGSDDNTSDEDSDSGILTKLVDTVINFFSEIFNAVFGGILDLINILIDNIGNLIDSFTGITGLIGSLFGFLPDDMVAVLTSGLAVIFLVIILKIAMR